MTSLTGKAIELFKDVSRKLHNLLKEDALGDTLTSLRSRARNTPSMLVTEGLPQTLAFLASKADKNVYKALTAPSEADLSNVKGEDAGYAAYLYVVMRFLKESKLTGRDARSIEEVVEVIKELDSSASLTSIAHNLLLNFMLEFKKVAEALIGE